MTEQKKKPVRLEIDRGILQSTAEAAVPIQATGVSRKDKNVSAAKQAVPPPAAGYDLRLRFEKKGRGGQPVFVLYSVLPASLQRAKVPNLEELGRILRGNLGCGGTVTDAEVILQCRDRERLDAALARLGLKGQ